MVDIRATLRPLVDHPPDEPRPVAEIAERAVQVRRRRARRRSALLAVSAVALLVLVNMGRFREGSGDVTEVAPSQGDNATAAEPPDGSTDRAGTTPGTPKEPAATTSTTPTTTQAPATAPPTTTTPPPPRPDGPPDPFAGLEAEHYDSQQGAAITTIPGGGHGIEVGDGGYVAFHRVDFGGSLATRFEARIAPTAGSGVGGILEVRLHAEDSPPFGTLEVTETVMRSGEPITVSTDIPAIGGQAAVFVTFASSEGEAPAIIDWFRFQP